MDVRLIPHRRESAAWNLALEEALFLKSKEKLKQGLPVQPVVKTYSFRKPSVVLGHRQDINEVDSQYIEEQGLDMTMRTTGGGSVYLGREDLQYSLILPTHYNKNLLSKVNSKITNSLQNLGLPAQLKNKTGHDIVRVDDKGSIFDAQRRYKNLILHHGTTLVDNFDYDHMPQALKASKKELKTLETGNLWLRQLEQVKEKALVKSFQQNLPEETSVKKKDYTGEEIKLARKLYKEFYTDKNKYSDGKKKFGICYLTDSEYDMEEYAEED